MTRKPASGSRRYGLMAFLGYLTLLICLGASAIVSFSNASKVVASNRLVLHTHQILTSLDQINIEALDVESNQRGYVITGQPIYLEGLENAIKRGRQAMGEAKSLMKDNPAQERRLAQLEIVIADKIFYSRQLIELRQSQGRPAAAISLIEGKGQRLKDQIRTDLEKVEAEEQRYLTSHLKGSEVSVSRAAAFFLVQTAVVPVLLTGLYFLFSRFMRIQRKARDVEAAYRLDVEAKVREKEMAEAEVARIKAVLDAEVARVKAEADAEVGRVMIELERTNRELQEVARIKEVLDAEVARVKAEADAEVGRVMIELERSNRELQDFAFVASHDLQEPLRKIQSFGDRIKTKEGDKLGPESLDYLDRMRNAAGRMQVLIDDILSLSRLATKPQAFVPVDLNVTFAGVLEDLRGRIEETGAKIEMGSLPTVVADPTQMQQLMLNLAGNALKFRRPEVAPVIRIESSETGSAGAEMIKLTVRDNGIGFEQRHAEKIFTVFQRLHGRGGYEGTGIGLAICRRIVERHGGSITATSKPEEGAVFDILLPVRQFQGVK